MLGWKTFSKKTTQKPNDLANKRTFKRNTMGLLLRNNQCLIFVLTSHPHHVLCRNTQYIYRTVFPITHANPINASDCHSSWGLFRNSKTFLKKSNWFRIQYDTLTRPQGIILNLHPRRVEHNFGHVKFTSLVFKSK